MYLYGQGSAADLTAANEDGSYRFTLSAAAVTVGAGTDAVTYDALSGTADYRIIEGQPQSLTDTLFTVRPLTVKGKQAGNVTLTVTLMDTEGLHPVHSLHPDGGGHPGDRHPPGG